MLCFRNGVYGYLQMQVHSTYEPYDDCYSNHIKKQHLLKNMPRTERNLTGERQWLFYWPEPYLTVSIIIVIFPNERVFKKFSSMCNYLRATTNCQTSLDLAVILVHTFDTYRSPKPQYLARY